MKNNMMKQMMQMQQQMKTAQEELAAQTIKVSSGGGAVEIEISGAQRIQNVMVSAELLESGDTEMVGDILVAAINEAIEKSQEMAADKLGALTGGLGLPGF